MELSYRTVTLPLGAPFRISRSTDLEVDLVEVELVLNGATGYGEATPQDHYGESVASTSAFLSQAGELLGDDPFALEEIGARLAEIPGETAAKAFVEEHAERLGEDPFALEEIGERLAAVPG